MVNSVPKSITSSSRMYGVPAVSCACAASRSDDAAIASAAVAEMAETTAPVRVRWRARLRIARRREPRARCAAGSSTLTYAGAMAHAPSSTATPPRIAVIAHSCQCPPESPPEPFAPTTASPSSARPPAATHAPAIGSHRGTLPSGRRPASAASTGSRLVVRAGSSARSSPRRCRAARSVPGRTVARCTGARLAGRGDRRMACSAPGARAETDSHERAHDSRPRSLQEQHSAQQLRRRTVRGELAESDELAARAGRERGGDHDARDRQHERADDPTPAHLSFGVLGSVVEPGAWRRARATPAAPNRRPRDSRALASSSRGRRFGEVDEQRWRRLTWPRNALAGREDDARSFPAVGELADAGDREVVAHRAHEPERAAGTDVQVVCRRASGRSRCRASAPGPTSPARFPASTDRGSQVGDLHFAAMRVDRADEAAFDVAETEATAARREQRRRPRIRPSWSPGYDCVGRSVLAPPVFERRLVIRSHDDVGHDHPGHRNRDEEGDEQRSPGAMAYFTARVAWPAAGRRDRPLLRAGV